MGVPICCSGACFGKVDMPSIAYRNGKGGGACKFVDMPVKGIRAEGDLMDMAAHAWEGFAGNRCKAVVMGVFASLGNKGAADDLVYMLLSPGTGAGVSSFVIA